MENIHNFEKGQIIGSLEIIEEVPIEERPNRNSRYFLCKCSCGRVSKIAIRRLVGFGFSCCFLCSKRKAGSERKKNYERRRKEYAHRSLFESTQEKKFEEVDELLSLKSKRFEDL